MATWLQIWYLSYPKRPTLKSRTAELGKWTIFCLKIKWCSLFQFMFSISFRGEGGRQVELACDDQEQCDFWVLSVQRARLAALIISLTPVGVIYIYSRKPFLNIQNFAKQLDVLLFCGSWSNWSLLIIFVWYRCIWRVKLYTDLI